uniref:Uncharacterized protein n=1 Tax=Amphimedon queenslandica TaxID=400682 RepID=A0A1X7VSB7_AMPQE
MVHIEKSDLEPTVCKKVHEAFPSVFSKSRSLAEVMPQDLGYATWTGEAVSALAGQGCLYVLPLNPSVTSSKEAPDATVNVLSPQITAHHSFLTIPGVGVSLTHTHTTTHTAISSDTPVSSAEALPSLSDDEILTAIHDPFIGGYILELAGLKQPEYQVSLHVFESL